MIIKVKKLTTVINEVSIYLSVYPSIYLYIYAYGAIKAVIGRGKAKKYNYYKYLFISFPLLSEPAHELKNSKGAVICVG